MKTDTIVFIKNNPLIYIDLMLSIHWVDCLLKLNRILVQLLSNAGRDKINTQLKIERSLLLL